MPHLLASNHLHHASSCLLWEVGAFSRTRTTSTSISTTYIRTTVHDFSASQATAQGTTKVEEKMWRSRSKNPCRRQAANNNSCTCQEGNILIYQGIANYQFPSVQERGCNITWEIGTTNQIGLFLISDCKLLRKVNDYQQVLRDVMFHTTTSKSARVAIEKGQKLYIAEIHMI